jgi:hypothetical protein
MAFLRTVMHKNELPKLVDRQGECYLDFGDGVPLFLRSAHDPGSFDGLDVGWAGGDEIRHWSKESWEVFLGRVRVHCRMPQKVASSTPAMHWMADEFNTGRKNRELIISPTRDNARNLAPNFIENLRLSYSKRLQKAVIDGQFTILEGAVYEAFDSNDISPWFVDYDPKANTDRRTILMVDPGFRRSAWMWAHELGPTEWIIFDQIMPNSTSDDACVQMVNDRGWPIDEIWTDPAAEATQSAFDFDTIDMMQSIKTRSTGKAIRYVVPPFNRISYGVDKLRTLLGDPEHGQPVRLKFAKRLKQLERTWQRGVVRDLAAYQYPEIKDGRPTTDLPLKDGRTDHSMDALRHFAVGMWLTSPLRRLDSKLAKAKSQGFKVAHN